MTLADNVHRLTREHLTTATGRLATVPALLDQLADRIKPDAGGARSGAASISLPINATALDLLRKIEHEAVDNQRELGGRFWGRPFDIIRSWASDVTDTEWVGYLEQVTREWCDQIETVTSDIKPWHPSRPCPSCGARFHGEDNAPVLSVHWIGKDGHSKHPEEWAMDCSACGAGWTGANLGAVAWAMASDAHDAG